MKRIGGRLDSRLISSGLQCPSLRTDFRNTNRNKQATGASAGKVPQASFSTVRGPTLQQRPPGSLGMNWQLLQTPKLFRGPASLKIQHMYSQKPDTGRDNNVLLDAMALNRLLDDTATLLVSRVCDPYRVIEHKGSVVALQLPRKLPQEICLQIREWPPRHPRVTRPRADGYISQWSRKLGSGHLPCPIYHVR